MRVAAKTGWTRASIALAACCAAMGAHRALAQEKAQSAPPPITLKDGDRIVFLGDGFFEREYEHGYIETAITSRFPDLKLTFRNLGWTGDTVWGDGRAGFETAKEGFARRAALVKELKPNLILVCYGMNESFAGEPGLAKFEEGLKALLDSLEETGAEVVLIGPIGHEALGPPFPDPEEHNRSLGKYRDVIKATGRARGMRVVDMAPQRNGPVWALAGGARVTTDGIHLNSLGYWLAASLIELTGALPAGRGSPDWGVWLERDGTPHTNRLRSPVNGTTLTDVRADEKGLRFVASDVRLVPVGPRVTLQRNLDTVMRFAAVNGLSQGRYALRIDGREVAVRSSEDWSQFMRVQLGDGPEVDQAEALRRAIVDKNKLLFHRLRPQNETYLYLFRKHEQGHMAGEVPQFDPLIAEKEAEIDRLKKPVPHTYELIRVEEEKK
jgi:lysophospholipase L1-like esterase